MSIAGDIITEKSWKIVLTKNKFKDNGLQRALANYDKADEEDHEACLKSIAMVNQCATNLKKSKDAASVPAVLDHITDLLEAIQAELKDLSKAKAEKQKADAIAAKKEQQAAHDASHDEEQEAEEGAHGDRLMACFKKLKSSRDMKLNFIACDAKPYLGLVISKQPIGAKHRTEVSEVSGGSKKYFKPGTVWVDNGKLVFDMDKPPAGFAAKMKKAFKYFTSLNIGVIVGDQTDEDEEGETETPETEKVKETPTAAKGPEEGVKTAPTNAPEAGVQDAGNAKPADAEEAAKAAASKSVKISATVGHGGKNKPEDVMAVQAALNERAKAGLDEDGKIGSKTIQAIKNFQKSLGMPYPDGLVEPGNLTEKALNGEKITVSEKPKPAKSAPGGGAGGAAKAGAGGAVGGAVKGAEGGAKGGGMFGPGFAEALRKMMKEATERKKRAEKLYQDAIKKMEEAAKLGGNQTVDPKYKEALQKAYEANQEHDNSFAELIKQALKAQDEAKAKELEEMIKTGQSVMKVLEGAAGTILRIV